MIPRRLVIHSPSCAPLLPASTKSRLSNCKAQIQGVFVFCVLGWLQLGRLMNPVANPPSTLVPSLQSMVLIRIWATSSGTHHVHAQPCEPHTLHPHGSTKSPSSKLKAQIQGLCDLCALDCLTMREIVEQAVRTPFRSPTYINL